MWSEDVAKVRCPTPIPRMEAMTSCSTDHSNVLMPDQPQTRSLLRTKTCMWSLPSRDWNVMKSLQGMSFPGCESMSAL